MNVYERMALLMEWYALSVNNEAQRQIVATQIAETMVVMMPQLIQVAQIIDRDIPPTLEAIEAAAAFVQAPELEKAAPYAALVEALKKAGAL